MLGVANIRGNLLPIVDLKQFLEASAAVLHEGQRVLVVRQPGGNVVTIDELSATQLRRRAEDRRRRSRTAAMRISSLAPTASATTRACSASTSWPRTPEFQTGRG